MLDFFSAPESLSRTSLLSPPRLRNVVLNALLHVQDLLEEIIEVLPPIHEINV
jgi:hypothetical protein